MDTVPSGQLRPQGWPAHWLRASPLPPPLATSFRFLSSRKSWFLSVVSKDSYPKALSAANHQSRSFLGGDREGGQGHVPSPSTEAASRRLQPPTPHAPSWGVTAPGRPGAGKLTSSKQCGGPTAGACGDGWVWCRWTEARVEEPAGYEAPWVGLGPVRRGGLLRGSGTLCWASSRDGG